MQHPTLGHMSMDLSSVLAALTSHGVPSVTRTTIQVASPQGCTPGLAGPEPSGPFIHPGEHLLLRQWWTYLSQLRLKVYHIQGMKNENADFIGCNNFDALIGASFEAFVREAFA